MDYPGNLHRTDARKSLKGRHGETVAHGVGAVGNIL